ncbi:MAG: hypothetical protein ACEQSD_09200 [Flavobacteriales bacterium]
MLAWVKFIVVPVIVSLIIDLIFGVLSGVFRWEVASWPNLFGDFASSFLMGAVMYYFAPKGKMVASVIYAALFVSFTAYTSYSMAGTTGEIFEETVYYQFHVSRQIASILGFIAGIWIARPESKTNDQA